VRQLKNGMNSLLKKERADVDKELTACSTYHGLLEHEWIENGLN